MPVELRVAVQRMLREREARRNVVLTPAELCPAEQMYALSAYDRVPPRMFWNLLTLLQEMYRELLAHKAAGTQMPDDELIASLQAPITQNTAWQHPIFVALLDVLHARCTRG